MLLLRIELFRQSDAGAEAVEAEGIRMYWAGPAQASETWPYDTARMAELTPVGAALPGYYRAELGSHAGWRGAVQRIMIEVDVPEAMLENAGEHFSLYTKDLALAGYDANSGDMRMTVRRVAFLK